MKLKTLLANSTNRIIKLSDDYIDIPITLQLLQDEYNEYKVYI